MYSMCLACLFSIPTVKHYRRHIHVLNDFDFMNNFLANIFIEYIQTLCCILKQRINFEYKIKCINFYMDVGRKVHTDSTVDYNIFPHTHISYNGILYIVFSFLFASRTYNYNMFTKHKDTHNKWKCYECIE